MNILQKYALLLSSHIQVNPDDAIRTEQYICPECKDPVIFKKGPIIRPYFAHKANTQCTNYTNESHEHLVGKFVLKQLLDNGIPILILRTCGDCNLDFRCEIGQIEKENGDKIIDEHHFVHEGQDRYADVAWVQANGHIDYIFEICNTNPTHFDNRPEPWFEFKSKFLYDMAAHLPEILAEKTNIEIRCIRTTFREDARPHFLCGICEMNPKNIRGKIYFNQRGAGCGKTFESIQLLQNPDFADKDIFFYLTKMNSAKDVIIGEIDGQIKRGLLPGVELLQKRRERNQVVFTFRRSVERTIIFVVVGTIDSFTYAVANRTKIGGGGSIYFQNIVKAISQDDMSINKNGRIPYAGSYYELNTKSLVIIDEGQDLEKEYIEAFDKIIDRTGIDTYIIGDKLQSIMSEKNLFTHLENAKESHRIFKNTGKNIVKRFHNNQFIGLVNSIVKFKEYGLPEIEGICDGKCGYTHEDDDTPYVVNNELKNIFQIEPHEIHSYIEMLKIDMREKIRKHGYLPNNFMFIFPIVNEKNKFITLLYPALQQFWVDFFANPKSYTELVLENMRKSDYWAHKLVERENDSNYYQYVYWHRSENNQPINLNESTDSTRILSIHASKGNGCECVYFLGLSEFTLTCHTDGIKNTLVYESLLHVGLTRQKKYLFIGYDGKTNDDICKRLGSYSINQNKTPYIKDITSKISINNLSIAFISKLSIENQAIQINQIFDFESYKGCILPTDNKYKEKIDWGNHVIRFCVLKTNVDKYLCSLDEERSQQKAKMFQLQDKVNIIYVPFTEYKEKMYKLQENINHNIKQRQKEPKDRSYKNLTVPILIFINNESKTDYYKYHNVIETFCNVIIKKIKNGYYNFCPIECLIYCHLVEMIHHPYSLNISIIDIYRIISNYDDCFNSEENDTIGHNRKFGCKCRECFIKKTSGFIKPHNDIQTSIIKHFDATKHIDKIMASYHIGIAYYTNNEKISYRSDKSFNASNEFTISNKLHFIGESDHFMILIILVPQFNCMNYYDIMMKIMLDFFILTKDGLDKTVIAVIITLDKEEPIILDLNELIGENINKIKPLLKEFILMSYRKFHSRIFDFYEYYRINHDGKKDTAKSDLSFIYGLFEKDMKEKKENDMLYITHSFPKYIKNWFYETDKKIMMEKNKAVRKQLKTNILDPTWVEGELNIALEYATNAFLNIYENIDSEDEQ
jgi:hypothetical protein